MNPETGRICRTLRNAMVRAGDEVLSIRQRGLSYSKKGVLDIVTEADHAAEAILAQWVAEHVPQDGIVAEEGTSCPAISGLTWYFDPIDGTKSYVSGLDFFGISAGLEREGMPVTGGIYLPAHQEFIFAVVGEGVWISEPGGDMRPFKRSPFDRSFEESVASLALTAPNHSKLYTKFIQRCWNGIMLGSCVYEVFKMVMEGHTSAYIHTAATPFDVAGVWPIAKEAGFAVTPVDLRQGSVPFAVAQNEEILQEVLKICLLSLPRG